MGMPAEGQELRIPYPAESADVPGCMALAACARDSFPGWEEAEFLAQLTQYVARGEAWLFRAGSKIAAVLLYSKENRELAYLATAPDYRRKGLAARLVETAAAQFPVGAVLSVNTYREGDPAGAAARKFYKALGSVEGEQTEAFGYPCQTLKLVIRDGTPIPHAEQKT